MSVRGVIADMVGNPAEATIGFRNLRQTLLRLLPLHVALAADADTSYIEPLARLGSRYRGLMLGTLNYDLAVETAAAKAGTPLETGIRSWQRTGRLSFPGDALKLVKLHGSIDWKRLEADHADALTELRLPENRLKRVTASDRASRGWPSGVGYDPFLIYGQREKLRPEGPFLDLRAEYLRGVFAVRRLFIVGYSFGDDHINAILTRWLNTDLRRQLVVVDPHFPDREPGGDPWGYRGHLTRWLVPDSVAMRAGTTKHAARLVVLRERASWLFDRLERDERRTLNVIDRAAELISAVPPRLYDKNWYRVHRP